MVELDDGSLVILLFISVKFMEISLCIHLMNGCLDFKLRFGLIDLCPGQRKTIFH